MRTSRSHSAIGIALVLIGFLAACSGDDDTDAKTYFPQTSEDNVLDNLILAYNQQDIEGYSRLFASDYQFYFDPASRTELGIEFWSRTTDSLQTEALFSSPLVSRVELTMEWTRGSATGSGLQQLPGRREWTKLFIRNLALDVDVTCPGRELTTFRMENQVQRIFFTRGRSFPPSGPADTLLYIGEWRDDGAALQTSTGVPATVSNTWSGIKVGALDCE